MSSQAFRAALRSTARFASQRNLLASSSTVAPRQALFSLRQTARSYASHAPHTTPAAAHHTESDAAWVVTIVIQRSIGQLSEEYASTLYFIKHVDITLYFFCCCF